jgi:hypothetical protein
VIVLFLSGFGFRSAGSRSYGSEVCNVDSFDDRQQTSGLPWEHSASQPAVPGSGRLTSRDSGPGLRVSDSERDLVATELGEHFQEGRLDQSEFDERLTLALRARTRGDLAALLADLPRQRRPVGPRAPGQAGPPSRGGPGTGDRLLPLLIPLLFVVILTSGLAARGGPHSAAGVLPLLWLWWLIPIVVFRARRGRGAQDQGTQDR